MHKKIIILICYYGKFPWYFPYFLHSCRFNRGIDFHIFSDCAYNGQVPDNVSITYMSLSDLKTLAGEQLGFTINIDFPYKLCDYKPAYGLIFSKYIEGYEFWGHSDIDMIYGDIMSFFTDEFLQHYDYISLRHDYTTGCFALYRNTGLMNNIFKRSRHYKKVFTESPHFCFDECNFAWDELTEGKSIFELQTDIESFTHIIKSAEKNNDIRCHFDFLLVEGVPGRIRFDKGRVIYKNSFDCIMYHLYWLKKVHVPRKVPRPVPDSYFISPTRIYFKT